jgi:hypothetical protein
LYIIYSGKRLGKGMESCGVGNSGEIYRNSSLGSSSNISNGGGDAGGGGGGGGGNNSRS